MFLSTDGTIHVVSNLVLRCAVRLHVFGDPLAISASLFTQKDMYQTGYILAQDE